MPEQLFDELEQAAMALDMAETYEVLKRIAGIQPELADISDSTFFRNKETMNW